MDAQAAESLLKQILDEDNIQWTCESGFIRFQVQRDGMRWELDCLCRKGGVVIFGRYPFRASDRDKAARCCGEANLRLDRGAMVLPSDGRPVYRDYVVMDDAYAASDRLREALDFNIRVVTRFWGRMEQAAGTA